MAKNKPLTKKPFAILLSFAGLLGLSLQTGCTSVLTGETNISNSVLMNATHNIQEPMIGLEKTNTLITTTQRSSASNRDTSILVDNYPEKHIVVKGDTLWDISAKFLRDPWLWPQVWDQNQQIRNPHLIYPGDVITLRWCNGKPCFGFGDGTLRLSPQVRYEDLGDAIPTIPYEAIAGFLSKPTVLDSGLADTLPYVLASADGRLVMSQGNEVYVRQNLGSLAKGSDYNIFNIGDPYIDTETGIVLGIEALYVGEGNVYRSGDPSTMKIRKSRREISRGDRMLPFDHERDIELNFMPTVAAPGTDGTIISVVEGVDYVGQYDIIVINRGASSGLKRGNVVSIYQKGDEVWDPYNRQTPPENTQAKKDKNWFERFFSRDGFRVKHSKNPGEFVKLPDEDAGIGLVFRVYDNISYALVMNSERELHKGDLIKAP